MYYLYYLLFVNEEYVIVIVGSYDFNTFTSNLQLFRSTSF